MVLPDGAMTLNEPPSHPVEVAAWAGAAARAAMRALAASATGMRNGGPFREDRGERRRAAPSGAGVHRSGRGGISVPLRSTRDAHGTSGQGPTRNGTLVAVDVAPAAHRRA